MIVNPQNFILNEIPKFHPLSHDYKEWWKEQKRRCIEGYWVGGQYMPGRLYFYINFSTILLNKSMHSKHKVKGKPKLWDVFWELSNYWLEARGFTGFEKDPKIQELTEAINNGDSEKEEEIRSKLESPRKILNDAQHGLIGKDLGKPVYFNEAKNLMMLGNRGYGKSYYAANAIVAHEFLFDGMTEYIPPEEADFIPSTEVVVGAGDSYYSRIMLQKTKMCLENIPGGQMVNGIYYPSPLSKKWQGNVLNAGQDAVSKYKKKMGGQWKEAGTMSTIKHRSFKDNPFAANGTRPANLVLEEAGIFDNLEESHAASVDTMKDGNYKFGSEFILGTGGSMESGAIDASKMFYDPESYDILTFEDEWEHSGKIGYFVPAYKGQHQFKDEKGNTNEELGKKTLEEERQKVKKGKNAVTILQGMKQNQPLVPSEMFLTSGSNVFPVAELNETLKRLEKGDLYKRKGTVGSLIFDSTAPSGVSFKPDVEKRLKPIDQFPHKTTDSTEGALVIYEFPIFDKEGKVPRDLYVIGHDPVRTDSEEGSLNSVYVMKTRKYMHTYGYDEIVAQYVGRPDSGRDPVNELLEKLAMFYGNSNEMIYYENMVGNTKEYFEKRRKLRLLAKQPRTVMSKKADTGPKDNSDYGFPMSSASHKQNAELYIRDFLLSERGVDDDGNTIRNLDIIPDRALVQELMKYNRKGNFDRVIGLAGCIIGLEEQFNEYEQERKEDNVQKAAKFFANNPAVFKNNIDNDDKRLFSNTA